MPVWLVYMITISIIPGVFFLKQSFPLPLYFQVVGKKYIRLYPASLSEELYPYSETMLCNSSQVDLDNIDETKFPKVHDLEFFDCILDEGEMLYIPPKWWHYVRSLSLSFSVSFWWSDGGSSTAFS